jgi:hypothetical protein
MWSNLQPQGRKYYALTMAGLLNKMTVITVNTLPFSVNREVAFLEWADSLLQRIRVFFGLRNKR